MTLKRYRRYRMDFSGHWLNAFCILCGLSFFLRVEYYFMFVNPTLCSTPEIIFSMILPLVLTAAAMVVLKFVKWNAPGTVVLLGAAMCLSLMIGTFFAGGWFRILLAVIFYLGTGALLVLTIWGFVPTRQFSVIAFCGIFLIRILFFRPEMGLLPIVLELSELTMLAAVTILPLSMIPVKLKKRR